MIIKRERLELESLLKDKSRMDKLDTVLRNDIFDFCRNSYNLQRKEEKIKRLKSVIKDEQIKMRNLSKKLTKEYHFVVNELSLGKPPVNITPEKKGNSYRLDINYKGKRRKVTIGKSFKELDELCKKHNLTLYKKINEKVNEVNWKKMVKNHLKYYVSNVVNSLTRDDFENFGQIVINSKTLKLEFIPKKDELDKKRGKTTKKKSIPDYPNTKGVSKNSNSGVLKFGGGNTGWNSKVTNVDDVPRWISQSTKEDSEVKRLMKKNKMGGNTKGRKK